MIANYIFAQLAQTPFKKPPRSKKSLTDAFLLEFKIRRDSTIYTEEQECLERACSPEAKAYVWSQFLESQSIDYPMRFIASAKWLALNQEHAPPDYYSNYGDSQPVSAECLLLMASDLPSQRSVDYIETWLHSQQSLLGTNTLPIELARIEFKHWDKKFLPQSYTNQSLWLHVILPTVPHLSDATKQSMRIPYLPFVLNEIAVESMLVDIPAALHP